MGRQAYAPYYNRAMDSELEARRMADAQRLVDALAKALPDDAANFTFMIEYDDGAQMHGSAKREPDINPRQLVM